MLLQEILWKPVIKDSATFEPIEYAITAIASSKTIIARRVVTKGPLALYSRMIARDAAGAVAQEIAPRTIAIGRKVWRRLGLGLSILIMKGPRNATGIVTHIQAPNASKGVIIAIFFPNCFSLFRYKPPPTR